MNTTVLGQSAAGAARRTTLDLMGAAADAIDTVAATIARAASDALSAEGVTLVVQNSGSLISIQFAAVAAHDTTP